MTNARPAETVRILIGCLLSGKMYSDYYAECIEQQLAMLVIPTKEICDETIAEVVDLVEYIGEVLKTGMHPHQKPDDNVWPQDSSRVLAAGTPLFPSADDPMVSAYRAAFVGWQGDLKEKVELLVLLLQAVCELSHTIAT